MKQTWLTLFACWQLATVASAADWPQFRGPTGMGLVTSNRLPLRWSADENIKWKVPVPGSGWSSPIVVGDRIYLTSAVPVADSKDLKLVALALSAADGSVVWETEVFRQDGEKAPDIHKKNSHASPTPLVENNRLYVHFGHQGTACLDLQGQVLWRNDELHYPPNHGNGGSPIVVGDLLVFSCDGSEDPFVAALDKASGKVRWRTPRSVDHPKKFSFSTPTAIEVGWQTQIISAGSGQVCAYDPADGKEIWQARYEGYSVVPKPLYGHGLIFVGSGFESPELLAIRTDGRGDVTDTHVVWKEKKGAPNTPSPLLVGDELFVISDAGIASCFDARTGKLHWRNRIGGKFSASPLHADGKIYLQSEDGVGTILRADKNFEVLATNSLDELTLASPAAVDGTLYLRSESKLYRIEDRR
jgi:outer membrane protein assembly factor BamB